MSEFSQAIEATKKQCGPEIKKDGLLYDVDLLGKTAEKALSNANTWKDKALFNDRTKTGANAINTRLEQGGQYACSQIADALQMTSARGKIEFPQAEKIVTKTITAQAPRSQGLNNVAMYAQGTSRIDEQINRAMNGK
ncbi:MAG: hypothetical protein PHH16_04440 [Candidatus Gracilibacteria bacterium]|nr:hypothetical protein [Candidatus Gracilibacteria bacterium]